MQPILYVIFVNCKNIKTTCHVNNFVGTEYYFFAEKNTKITFFERSNFDPLLLNINNTTLSLPPKLRISFKQTLIPLAWKYFLNCYTPMPSAPRTPVYLLIGMRLMWLSRRACIHFDSGFVKFIIIVYLSQRQKIHWIKYTKKNFSNCLNFLHGGWLGLVLSTKFSFWNLQFARKLKKSNKLGQLAGQNSDFFFKEFGSKHQTPGKAWENFPMNCLWLRIVIKIKI